MGGQNGKVLKELTRPGWGVGFTEPGKSLLHGNFHKSTRTVAKTKLRLSAPHPGLVLHTVSISFSVPLSMA